MAFFGEAEPCAMEKALTLKYGEEHTKTVDCCSDDVTVFQGQDELKRQLETMAIDTLVFIRTFTLSYMLLHEGDEKQYVPFDGYPPPLLTSDFQLLYEQYLI